MGTCVFLSTQCQFGGLTAQAYLTLPSSDAAVSPANTHTLHPAGGEASSRKENINLLTPLPDGSASTCTIARGPRKLDHGWERDYNISHDAANIIPSWS